MMNDNQPYNPNYVLHQNAGALPSTGGEYDAVIIDDQQTTDINNHRTTSRRQVGGAAVAGTVAGFAIAGPIVGVAAGGAVAYTAALSNGQAGNAARQTGEAVSTVGDKAKEYNKQHEITKKSLTMAKSAIQKAKQFDEKHKVVEGTKNLANSAVQKTKEMNDKHHVVDRSKQTATKIANSAKEVNKKHHVTSKTKIAASTVMSKAKDVEEKHHVTEKTKRAASLTAKQVACGVKFISKSINGSGKKDAGGDSNTKGDGHNTATTVSVNKRLIHIIMLERLLSYDHEIVKYECEIIYSQP